MGFLWVSYGFPMGWIMNQAVDHPTWDRHGLALPRSPTAWSRRSRPKIVSPGGPVLHLGLKPAACMKLNSKTITMIVCTNYGNDIHIYIYMYTVNFVIHTWIKMCQIHPNSSKFKIPMYVGSSFDPHPYFRPFGSGLGVSILPQAAPWVARMLR